MHRYFFHLTNGKEEVPDLEGVVQVDLEAAYDYAIEEARFLIDRRMVKAWSQWRIDIADETGCPVLTVPFSQAWDDIGECAWKGDPGVKQPVELPRAKPQEPPADPLLHRVDAALARAARLQAEHAELRERVWNQYQRLQHIAAELDPVFTRRAAPSCGSGTFRLGRQPRRKPASLT